MEMPHTQRKGFARELVEVKKRRVVIENGSFYKLTNFYVQTAINHLIDKQTNIEIIGALGTRNDRDTISVNEKKL